MPPRPTAETANLVPGDTPNGAAYERDFYTWSLEQAHLLREGRFDALDRDNVAEEIESLRREQFNKLESALRVLLVHMLKWDHQPRKRTRSWTLSIKEQRAVLRNVLADNPGLKSRLDEALARANEQARLVAARETGLDENAFPPACPYGVDAITERVFAA
jgi:hypothetical protein